jgi:hypothetical protein
MLPRERLGGTVRALQVLVAAVVCAAPLASQDFGGAAKVVELAGRVSMFRDNYEVALFVGNVVKPQQVVFTGPDGYAKFELADGSTFEVFQNSKVVFHPTSASWEDLLNVIIGHVKLYIEHKNGPNHNRVTTQTAIISVRGTVFDVDAEDEDTTLISVDEGEVSVRHAVLSGEVILHAGESLRVYKDQPLARNKVDKGGIARAALRVAEGVGAMARRGGLAGGGIGIPGGGAQGDKGPPKGGGTSTGGPSGNGAPPPPPPPPTN